MSDDRRDFIKKAGFGLFGALSMFTKGGAAPEPESEPKQRPEPEPEPIPEPPPYFAHTCYTSIGRFWDD